MKKLLFVPLFLIVSFCFSQNSKQIIGKPVKIGNLLVAQFDFFVEMDRHDADKACRELGKGWRLPTKYELKILYKNRNKIGGFKYSGYWSQDIFPINDNLFHYWIMRFQDGVIDTTDFDEPLLARAVKSI